MNLFQTLDYPSPSFSHDAPHATPIIAVSDFDTSVNAFSHLTLFPQLPSLLNHSTSAE